MLTVLGGLAEFERHLILSRTNEGGSELRLAVFGSEGRLACRPINGGRRWHLVPLTLAEQGP